MNTIEPNTFLIKATLSSYSPPAFQSKINRSCKDLITEINVQLALFRDQLIHIGQPHDCPELRERVRRLRRACVEATKQTSQLVLPTCKNSRQLRPAALEGGARAAADGCLARLMRLRGLINGHCLGANATFTYAQQVNSIGSKRKCSE
ncbi:hypothetical protein EVAR_79046_1 [Eumeta japonica]|uniref:Uncharacterized protein n=1 Tax=Eumeta variegata TaxID=151549 RepID=A0A4C1XS28_EUMVA|nr:hypothetical protein EVAR_79046_1 [Eumeta japonica]